MNALDPGGNYIVCAIPFYGQVSCGAVLVGAIILGLGADHSADVLDNGQVDGTSPLGNPTGALVQGGYDVVQNANNEPGIGHNGGPQIGGVQDDGSYVTPGGNTIGNHGAKGTGDIYIGGKGWTPEQIDDVVDNPVPTRSGTLQNGGRLLTGSDGHWVIVDENGIIRQTSNRHEGLGHNENDPPDYEPDEKDE